MPKKYRKKPMEVLAFQWNPDVSIRKRPEWIKKEFRNKKIKQFGVCLRIMTIDGWHTARPSDYLIMGAFDEIYPCKESVFEETYEEVEE